MNSNKIVITEDESRICKIDGKKFNSNREMIWYVRKNYNLSFEEYIIKCYYNGNRPVCLASGEKLSFKGNKLGPWFSDYAKNKAPRKKHSDETKLKIKEGCKKTSLKKYGVENVFELEWCKEKIKNTNLEKYGAINPMLSKEVSDKNRTNQMRTFYEKLLNNSNRNNFCIPMFTFEEYLGVQLQNKYDFKCKKCNEIFKDEIDEGKLPRCPICYPPTRSNDEEDLYEFIKSNYIGEVFQSVKNILSNNRELDIYIPDKKVAIEYNGIYWHSELSGKTRNYHLDKTKECERLGIRLIHVFENEWNLKRDIVKSKILNILGVRSGSIYARKCKIKIPEQSEKSEFLEKNHIQGDDNSSIYYGLYNEVELVSIMTFGPTRIALGSESEEGSYELIRYCSDLKFNVIGGAGKLLTHFIKENSPKKIRTYADRRWSGKTNMYEKIGFSFIGTSLPSEYYFKQSNTNKLYHRFNFRKSLLKKKLEKFDVGLSGWENMKANGYDRIWDCGTFKYEMIIK